MKISGFSFVRNATMFGYPFLESLKSLSPNTDEIIVACGDSADDTTEQIQSLCKTDKKIVIVPTVWNSNRREGGQELAEQTDIALQRCTGDWCIYLQADEVLHEDDLPLLRREIEVADANPNIEALLFRWRHFFGSYEYIGRGRQWYRREIRAFRNNGKVVSWGDAQGFRIRDENGTVRKLRAKQTDIRIFHYGWVRHPRIQQLKQKYFNTLWHNDDWIEKNIPNVEEFDYCAKELELFAETHPQIMKEKIAHDRVWTQYFDPNRTSPKTPIEYMLDLIEKFTGIRIGEYKNFSEV